MYQNQFNSVQRRRHPVRRFITSLLFLGILLGVLGFIVYRAQNGTSVTVGPHPTVIINDCTGSVHVRAGSANNQVILQQGWAPFVFYSLDQSSNTLTVDACDLTIIVPPTTDVKISADTLIDILGVTGQFSLTSNGGSISLVQDTLTGQSSLDNNGGPITFQGALSPQTQTTFDENGGLIDLTLPGNASFHLNVTGIQGTVTSEFPEVQASQNDIHTNVGSSPSAQLTLSVNDTPIVLHKSTN